MFILLEVLTVLLILLVKPLKIKMQMLTITAKKAYFNHKIRELRNHLSEHLADFRRRNEIASLAKNIAIHVIS